ncbi:MAG: M15 family metallopeptidase [Bacilli bacterium]|nr:M15 family metallopeptidase [Bacilli bacterium]
MKKEEILNDLNKYFNGRYIADSDEIYKRIFNKTYKKNPDISIEDLVYIKLMYYNYNHEIKQGEMIVNKDIFLDVIDIFSELFYNEYEIYSVKLIDDLWQGDSLSSDKASMKANNCSSFNYRRILGKNYLSKHATGHAIDINPVENPYIRFDENNQPIYDNLSDEEIYYAENRNKNLKHVITHDDLAYKLFTEHNFEWGGDWNDPGDPKDYQHFEKIMKK